MTRAAWLCIVVWFASLGVFGCDPSDPCDRGQYADHGACYALPRDGGDDASVAVDGAVGDADSGELSYEGFGDACDRPEDCKGAAPSCGAPTSPVCTAVNCMGKPAACPPDWTCLDVTGLSPDPSVKSACVKL